MHNFDEIRPTWEGICESRIYAFDGITMFHLAAPLMVFGELGRLGLASDWETRLWSDEAGLGADGRGLPGGGGGGSEHGRLGRHRDHPVLAAAARRRSPTAFRGEVVRAHGRGALIAGLCLGAFAIADAGVLKGRSAVTHWEMMPIWLSAAPVVRSTPRCSTSTMAM